MNNQIAKHEPKAITDKELIDYMDTMGLAQKLNEKEKLSFIQIAKAYNLNPFKREIYAVKYKEGDTLTIITGYESYIKRAERSGLLDGWGVMTEGKVSDDSLRAILTIYRKDRKRAFVHEVLYSEYVQTKEEYVNGQKTGKRVPNTFWQKAHTMIKKVAIAQGFRLCFSDELGGMPYTADEVPETVDVEHTELKPTPQPIIDNHVHAVNAIKKHASDGLLFETWSRIDLPTQSHPSVVDELTSAFVSQIDNCKKESELKAIWASIGLYGKDKEFQKNVNIAAKKDEKKEELTAKPIANGVV